MVVLGSPGTKPVHTHFSRSRICSTMTDRSSSLFTRLAWKGADEGAGEVEVEGGCGRGCGGRVSVSRSREKLVFPTYLLGLLTLLQLLQAVHLHQHIHALVVVLLDLLASVLLGELLVTDSKRGSTGAWEDKREGERVRGRRACRRQREDRADEL